MSDPRASGRPRLLVLLRHAKAEPHRDTDRSRRLTPRGHRDAHEVGRWLAERGVLPDLALVSPAARTLETLEDVLAALPESVPVQQVEGLYGADPRDVVEYLLGVPERVGTVLVVGHNPTMEELIWALQGRPASPWPESLPTSGLGLLRVDRAWADLEADAPSCELVDSYIGRGQEPAD